MADTFKTFDKAPVVGVVNIRQWSFAWREIIIAGIALLLLVLCLILAGLYGHAEGEKSRIEAMPAKSMRQNYCVNQSCLETASRTLELMNTSVDPCDDFFRYACGNYKNVKTATYDQDFRSVLADIDLESEKKLKEVLEKPVDREHEGSAERKLKHFFQSCTDDFTREKLLGTPFLKTVLPELGGWDLLGTWHEAQWDFGTTLQKVQADFWTDAFYGPSVKVDESDSKRYIIQLQPAGTGKYLNYHIYLSPNTEKYREDYKKFIRRVASLLMRDAKVTSDPDKLEQFVNDTFTMETNIAHLASDTGCFQQESRVTLTNLNSDTSNVLDWVDQLSYMYKEADITASTKVALKCELYFQNVTTMISNLPDADRKRMLHNYLIWRVAENFVQALSWEYIHANRELYEDIYQRTEFLGANRYCFGQMETYMPDALGALFIAEHFVEIHKRQTDDIAEELRFVLLEQLDQTPWMDAETRAYAKEKLHATSFKLGYPEWMTNHDLIDSLYDGLKVDASDYFGNRKSANGMLRSILSRRLKEGEDREEWSIKIYGTNLLNIQYWNQVLIPAGILQNPVYDFRQPHYKTFGSLGGILGQILNQVVDSAGKHYDKDGVFMGQNSWWTNKTTNNYRQLKHCVADAYHNVTRSLTNPDGSRRVVFFNALNYAPQAIGIINGVHLALTAYRKWVSDRGVVEKMLPGIDLTDTQMVLLSFTQSYCNHYDLFWSFYFSLFGFLENDIATNVALSQLPEFSEAFKCKETAKMNAAKRCDYY